jgi:preprotein translocase subunit YajC
MGDFIAFGIVILLLVMAYWSLVVFPKQRDFKKHNQYVQTLKVGDEVITYGGIIGTISKMDNDAGVAFVRVADSVELKMLTAALTRPYVPEDVSLNARIGVDPSAKPKI